MAEEALLALEGLPDKQFVWLENRLADAAWEGIVRPLPTTAREFERRSFGAGHLRVIRNRFYRLGYLAADSEEDNIDYALRTAIRQFQQEAGLTMDGWVGMQTWQALQELFAFEPPTELRRWLEGDSVTPALHRAVHLRLFTFGLLEGRSQASLDPIADGLREWERVLQLLGAEATLADGAELPIALLSRLFDLDRLFQDIASNRATIRARLMTGAPADRALLRRFLTCFVKIQLWLLGYEDIQPDGLPTPITRRRVINVVSSQMRYHYSPLYRAIREFWSDQGLSRKHGTIPQILLRTISGLAAVNTDERDAADERRSQAKEMVATLEKTDEGLDKQWREMSLGGRIWDGAKRLWRFLWGLIRRAVSQIVKKFRQIIRAAYQAAADAFSLLHRGFRIFADTVDLLFSREIPGSSEEIAMYHDHDHDFKVFMSSTASTASVSSFFEQLRTLLAGFHATTRVLKVFLGLAIASARLAAGPWAWWPLVRTLIALHGEINEDDGQVIRAPLPV